MKLNKLVVGLSLFITACNSNPAKQAEQQTKKIKQQQALSIELARQCDHETAELMQQIYNSNVGMTEAEKRTLNQRYQQKISDPLFESCNKLAWENHKHQMELQEIRRRYDMEYPTFFSKPFGYHCW
ncbi:hypothetical protein A6046_00125 [[Haemophilus] ducreyi]|uniref:Lipoprotein n=2 Tax=Haemophilus ducreyi TaxID=730 RepID=Q7VMC6_HAEDU|nr:hypothetical protein [[Haemophilus] ducreyi]AAP95931.1 hypothetical protein HD_1060 [[Haemophilus] ducreyi 35000HP]AKO30940.1 hypothetical protein RY60_04225 [[Haemophilus] ducreyi]AKO32379.1 hypothetical protein RZ57_04235 [[Haemophilus] ducreyi]AKO33831.1 hypothetical protein RZ58_04250 [[Haemophilus] ducreyi]AKO35277.1 hypothetical protein RZ59_04195 [[Haemophilus] ducreyi]